MYLSDFKNRRNTGLLQDTERPLLVLGNGPSIQNQLELIKRNREKFHVLTVNKFACSAEFELLKPSHYIMLDGDFFNFNERVFNDAINHPRVKLKPEFEIWQKQINSTWSALLSAEWDIEVFVPQIYKNSYIVKRALASGVKISVFNYTVLRGTESWVNTLFNRGLGMPQCQNVVNAAVFIGLLQRPISIYLLGLDHTFHLGIEVAEDNQLWETVSHFYSNDKPHKHPLLNEKTGDRVRLKDVFNSLSKVHVSYEMAKKVGQDMQIPIYNATTGGFVDAFERKSPF